MPEKFNDIAAVVYTKDYAAARFWYGRLIGREPDLEPIEAVGEWQITATAWLQLAEDADRAGKSAVRFGVDDLDATVDELHSQGVETTEPVVIAGMVKVVDVVDPDGNEVSFVQSLTAE